MSATDRTFNWSKGQLVKAVVKFWSIL